jgi:hypothetical protein
MSKSGSKEVCLCAHILYSPPLPWDSHLHIAILAVIEKSGKGILGLSVSAIVPL